PLDLRELSLDRESDGGARRLVGVVLPLHVRHELGQQLLVRPGLRRIPHELPQDDEVALEHVLEHARDVGMAERRLEDEEPDSLGVQRRETLFVRHTLRTGDAARSLRKPYLTDRSFPSIIAA